MKKPKNTKLYRTLFVITGGVLAFSLGGKNIAMSNSAAINNAFHCKTFEIVKKDSADGKVVDSEYFKSDFKKEDGTFDEAKLKTHMDSLGEEIEEEGAVLLKNNNNALPLKNNDKVSLLGQASVLTNYTTSGSSSTSGVTYPKMDEVFSSAGLQVNPTLTAFYTTGNGSKYQRTEEALIRKVKECPISEYDDVTKTSISTYGDAAILTLARDSGEGEDISTTGSDTMDGTYLSLSQEEYDLLKYLGDLKKTGSIKKIIVLLNSAVPIETDFLKDENISVDAALWIGNVGNRGLCGLADILLGKSNPSGKLTDTFLRDNLASPAMADWMLNKNSKFSVKYPNAKDYSLDPTQSYYGVYLEGIYVGYRYYETRYEDALLNQGNTSGFVYDDVVSYPFGYGLSYTNFEYSDYNVTQKEDGKSYDVSVTVKNTGEVKGKDVVEVFLQKPYTAYDKENGIEKASVELVGFEKTDDLEPGKSQQITINVSKEEFKSYDANKEKTYILDEGDYYLSIGNGAHEAVNNILSLKGKDGLGDKSLAKLALHQETLDTKTYSVSEETGNKITNQLDFCDMNKYENRGENSVLYVSRSDWNGTYPKVATSLKVNEKMASDLKAHKEIAVKDEKKPNYSQSNGLQLISLRSDEKTEIKYDDESWDRLLDQMSYEDQALLVSNSAFNTPSIASVGKPGTLDNDGPTGLVKTKTGTVLPSLAIWAASFNKDLLFRIGDGLAEDTLCAGYQSLYGPGVNIHRTPFGGRLNEYFSEDSYLTGYMAMEEVRGMQKKGVIPTVKHFIFNEEEANRNGIGIWLNEQEAREIMLKPFEMVMRKSMGNAHAIMSSFNRAGCIWTSASRNLLMNINRDEWDFDGYVITDMASSNGSSYMVYDDGIYNGTDLFLGNGDGKSLDSYRNNAAFANRIREACHRVLYVICNYSAAMNGITSDTIIVPLMPWWEATLNALWITALVLCILSFTLMVLTIIFRHMDDNSTKIEIVS